MCGFIYRPFGTRAETEACLVNIEHRGLPGRSHVVASPAGGYLGHTRLPIQGLGTEHDQPYVDPKKNKVYAYVGEIYNAPLNPGESDTEFLIREYQRDGDRCFSRFDGMWAFLVSGPHGTRVYVDALAKKPVYYNTATGEVASEAKALVFPGGRMDFDELYFSRVQKWGYCPGNRTPWKHIRSIKPGHVLIIPRGGVPFQEKYLRVDPPSFSDPYDILAAMETSVRRRMVSSDVPVALLVSGGLDSSIVFKTALKYRHGDVTVFHVNNGEEEYLNYLDIPGDINVVKVGSGDFEERSVDLKEVLYVNESPVDLGSMLPQYFLARELQKHGVHVALSGDGADELFGGYRRALDYDSQHSDIFDELVYYHLPRLDRHMAYRQVELRSPFLSTEVVRQALAVPREHRTEKQILKSVFSEVLPDEILNRKKEPLKSPVVREQGLEWVRTLCNHFKEYWS